MKLRKFLEPFESSEEVFVHRTDDGTEIEAKPESKELEPVLDFQVIYACPRIGGADWAYTYIEVENPPDPWVVACDADQYTVVRLSDCEEGRCCGEHFYFDWHDAQDDADIMNEIEGIKDAPRFDEE